MMTKDLYVKHERLDAIPHRDNVCAKLSKNETFVGMSSAVNTSADHKMCHPIPLKL